MGKFKQGEGGRPKGSPNRVTGELREWISNFISNNKDLIQQDFNTLDPKDRIMIFEKLLKYALPALQSTSLSTDFEKLTDEQLDKIIDELKEPKE
jgi:hypothetical protein